ncbi:MAG: HU family DNA-binding protein [Mycoplasmatales bacterium]
MTKQEIIENVAGETGLSKKDVGAVIESTFAEIKKSIKKGNKVTFVGFGNFEPKRNSARQGINPATKEAIQIKASNSVKFKVSKTFKDTLN